MTIDWMNAEPATAFAGGVMIGLAVLMLLFLNGRIAGISGILGGLLRPAPGERAWRLAFVAGLMLAPLCYLLARPLPPMTIAAGTPTLVLAGLLVGLGTRYGSGCTSGHGICGLARRSPRSLAATAAFMLAGFATVFLARHVFG